MDNDLIIRIWSEGNPGNILPMYLTAIKMKQELGYGKISHVNIPMFGISCDDFDINSSNGGIHDQFHPNGKRYGNVPFKGLSKIIPKTDAKFISIEGLCQNINNFPRQNDFDYDNHFPFLSSSSYGGGEDELVINIRGGEILDGISPLYPMIPVEFYEFLAKKTGKKIIFCGQLDDTIYLDEIKSKFPNATYLPSKGVKEDFDFIRRSKNIVPCLSTFSWFASWMSHAEKIYFPVAAQFNPAQHFYGNMVPLDDPRYEFYLFPIFDALPISSYKKYIDPVRNSWKYVSNDELRDILKKRSSNIDNYLLAFNHQEYLEMYPEYTSIFNDWGLKGLINSYINEGFFSDKMPCKVDRSFYTRNYQTAAIEISDGIFENEIEHYVMRGQFQGFSSKE